MNFGMEDETHEFKKSTAELEEAAKSVCAMLNKHGGGTILFGVLPNGEAKGLTVNESTLRDVSRKISESISPQIIPTVTKKSVEGKELVELTFKGTDKPYSCKGIYYIRSADENRVLPTNELRHLFEYNVQESWDAKLTDYTFADLNVSSIETLYKRAVKSERIKEEEFNPERLLEKLSLIKNGKLTNACHLLFGKNGPISLKMAVFATDEKLTFLDINRQSGNIIELLDEANSYISKNIRWTAIFSDWKRITVPEIPINAIREIVSNSFAHARYGTATEHEISIHPHSVNIYNPGEFPIGYKPEDFATSNLPSVVRNPLILKTLFLSEDVESYSSGFRRVYEECKAADVKTSYVLAREGFEFIFERKPLLAMRETSISSLTIDEEAILNLLKKDPTLSTKKMSTLLDRSERTIQRITNSLKEKGLIERIGKTKGGYWRIIEQ